MNTQRNTHIAPKMSQEEIVHFYTDGTVPERLENPTEQVRKDIINRYTNYSREDRNHE